MSQRYETLKQELREALLRRGFSNRRGDRFDKDGFRVYIRPLVVMVERELNPPRRILVGPTEYTQTHEQVTSRYYCRITSAEAALRDMLPAETLKTEAGMSETCLFCKSTLVPDFTTGESVCGNVKGCGMGVEVESRVDFINRVVRDAVGDDIRRSSGDDTKDAIWSGAFAMLSYLLNEGAVVLNQLRKVK